MSTATAPSQAATVTIGRERHALTGPSVRLDPRFYPVRADLTDVRLADRVFAPHYAMATARTAVAPCALRSGVGVDAPVISELLPGDCFDLLELTDQTAWGVSMTDGLVGYVDAAVLGDAVAATHRIVQREALFREAPDSNATILAASPMGARVTALGERGAFLLCDHGYVARDAVAPLDQGYPGGVAGAAVALIGLPERAAGRSGSGVDATGFVFLAHDLANIRAPRLFDAIGGSLGVAGGPGDVMIFNDHLAICVDDDSAVHVDGAVKRESLSQLEERYGALVARGRIG
ncbi:SH3 domain-containing protein [Sphingomonas sp. IW22]|uniref:SH3 domain-containing protein n=1 Tax=Sphingomonas sp. IW22 TaxID=3242489 RepID=UPI00351F99ED